MLNVKVQVSVKSILTMEFLDTFLSKYVQVIFRSDHFMNVSIISVNGLNAKKCFVMCKEFETNVHPSFY